MNSFARMYILSLDGMYPRSPRGNRIQELGRYFCLSSGIAAPIPAVGAELFLGQIDGTNKIIHALEA